MRSIRLASPSKINLHLRVGTPDETGFHPLRTWFITTDLHDIVACSVAVAEARHVELTCDRPDIPTDGTNLVVRAAHAYLDQLANHHDGADRVNVSFALTKRIPPGAGLGGGSGNAAAALRAIDALFSETLPDRPALRPIGATLGSDVPFFLGPTSAIGTGRGEVLEFAPLPRPRRALLMLPPFGVSTPAAYRALDRLRPTAPSSALDEFDVYEWADLDATNLLARLANDLEPAAFAIEPRLHALHRDSEALLNRCVRMSGSGSTLFTVFDDEASRAAAADAIARSGLELTPFACTLGVAPAGDSMSRAIF